MSAKEVAPETVWAKAGVDYDTYRADSLDCAMEGLAQNIDDTPEVKTLARASQQLESIDQSAQSLLSLDAGQMGRPDQPNGLDVAARKAADEQAVIAATQPAKQYARIKEIMFKAIRACMVRNGYTKIALTADQREHYSAMKGGADVHRAYLHRLASDPQVVEAQRLPAAG